MIAGKLNCLRSGFSGLLDSFSQQIWFLSSKELL